jgi:acyl-CoA thioester hydrolase
MRPPAARLILGSYLFNCELQTRLADIDRGQHVNNAVVALYHEEVRARMHMQIQGEASVLERNRGGGVVAHVGIHFLRELLYGRPITGAAAVASFGRTSYVLAQALFQDGACVGVADTVIAWREDGKSAPLPVDLRDQLQPYQLVAQTD